MQWLKDLKVAEFEKGVRAVWPLHSDAPIRSRRNVDAESAPNIGRVNLAELRGNVADVKSLFEHLLAEFSVSPSIRPSLYLLDSLLQEVGETLPLVLLFQRNLSLPWVCLPSSTGLLLDAMQPGSGPPTGHQVHQESPARRQRRRRISIREDAGGS